MSTNLPVPQNRNEKDFPHFNELLKLAETIIYNYNLDDQRSCESPGQREFVTYARPLDSSEYTVEGAEKQAKGIAQELKDLFPSLEFIPYAPSGKWWVAVQYYRAS